MTTNFEILSGYSANSSARQERQQGEPMHGAWMLELEKAMLALNDAHAADRSGRQRSEGQDGKEAGREEGERGIEQRSGDRSELPQKSGTELKSENTPIRSEDDMGAADASGDERRPLGKGNGQTSIMQVDSNGLNSVAGPSYLSSIPAGVSLALMQSAAHEGEAARKESAYVNSEPVKSSLEKNTSMPGTHRTPDAQAKQLAGDRLEEDVMGRGNASADSRAASESEEYAKRQIHLYKADDGLYAWVRDAELSAAQALAVAQALDAEFASAGTRMASVTVNGVKIQDKSAELSSAEIQDVYVEEQSQHFQEIYAKGGM